MLFRQCTHEILSKKLKSVSVLGSISYTYIKLPPKKRCYKYFNKYLFLSDIWYKLKVNQTGIYNQFEKCVLKPF